MAAITIAENDGQVSYTVGSTPSTGPFEIDFPFFFTSEISVVVRNAAGDETTLERDTDFTIAGTAADDGFAGGAVTLIAAASNSTVVITRDLATTKATNLPTSGPLSIRVLNTLLSRLFSWTQDLRRKYGISLHFPVGEPVSGQLPAVVDRKGHLLAFHATTGAPIVSNQTLATVEAGSTSAVASAAAAATSAGNAATSAAEAADSESAAAASAAAASNSAASLSGTSDTSVTIGTGSKAFTTLAGKSFSIGAYVMIVSADEPENWMFGQIAAYSGTSLTVDVQVTNGAGAWPLWTIEIAGVRGATGPTGVTGATGRSDPGGRVTFTTGTPIQSSNVAVTTVYYTPFVNDLVPIYDGANWSATPFAELGNVLTNSATGKAGPAATTTNSNYDLFVWNDSGTIRLTRGPAWSFTTARGTGAGTTELQQVNGIWTNKVAITNGPAANRGTYVGTIRTNGSSQAQWNAGGPASGGQAAILGLWNAYNRVRYYGKISDTTISWTYGTSAWRPAHNSSGMRVSWVGGLQNDFLTAEYSGLAVTSTGKAQAGVGLDSTSAPSGVYTTSGTSNAWSLFGELNDRSLGFHFAQALERAVDGVSVDYYSDGTGLTYDGWF